MLAYVRLLIREASNYGGPGWLMYDSVFCRNSEGTYSRWNYLDTSLYQVYIAGQRDKVVASCRHSHKIDHAAADCVVASVLLKMLPLSVEPGSFHSEKTSMNGKCPNPYSWQQPICTSWNAGNCRFPGKCSYARICSTCYGAPLCLQMPQTECPSICAETLGGALTETNGWWRVSQQLKLSAVA